MSWKEDLVKQINALRDKDFVDGRPVITVTFSMPWCREALFLDPTHCINLYPVGWVGPGYLLLDGSCSYRDTADQAIGVLKFVVSRDRKFNEIRVEDVVTGHVRIGEFPMFASVDFMSL